MKLSAFLLVVMFPAAALACGNPQTATEETQTAAAGAATLIGATPNYPPSPPGPPPTPELVTPLPAPTAGRTDCPSDWAGYQSDSARISLCYPPNWELSVSGAAPGHPEAFRLTDAQSGIFIGITMVDSTPWSSGTVGSLAQLCDTFSKVSGIPFTEETFQLANLTATGCAGHGDAGEEGVDPAHAFVLLPSGKYLQFYITRKSAGRQVDDTVVAALKTVKSQ